MRFLFPRWDILVPWRVLFGQKFFPVLVYRYILGKRNGIQYPKTNMNANTKNPQTVDAKKTNFTILKKSAFVSFGPPSFPSWFWDSSKAFHGFYFHHLGICFLVIFLRILAWDSSPLHHHLGKLDFCPTNLSKSKSLWPRTSFQWIFCWGFVTWIFWGRPPNWFHTNDMNSPLRLEKINKIPTKWWWKFAIYHARVR